MQRDVGTVPWVTTELVLHPSQFVSCARRPRAIDELKGGFQLKRANQIGETGVQANESPGLGCISVKTEGFVDWPNRMGGEWIARR